MGGLMEPAVEIAAERAAEKKSAETKKKTLIESVRKMMKKLNMTAQQAMDILDVPANKRKEYLALI